MIDINGNSPVYECNSEYKHKNIIIENNVTIDKANLDRFVIIGHDSIIRNSSILLRSSIGHDSYVSCSRIGKYCSIAYYNIVGAPIHSTDAVTTNSFYLRKKFGLCEEDTFIRQPDVCIGNDVWIGCNSVILAGVKIGDGAIIGAGSVVTNDVLPYEIVGGVSAKHIRFRFCEETIRRLEKIKWWDFPDEIMKENIELFSPLIKLDDNPDVLRKLEAISQKINSKSHT